MRYLKKFESTGYSRPVDNFSEDYQKVYIDTDILKDILIDISDETGNNIRFKGMYDLRAGNYTFYYNVNLESPIDIKYINIIENALEYYYQETGHEVCCSIDTDTKLHLFKKNVKSIKAMFFFRNDDNLTNYTDYIVISRTGYKVPKNSIFNGSGRSTGAK